MKLSLVIPAYNEEKRIARTVRQYAHFFASPAVAQHVVLHLIIVPNGCTDKTEEVCQQLADELPHVSVSTLVQGGKGRAIKHGFMQALTHANDVIGFVDADCATAPEEFYALCRKLRSYDDGITASRYMPGAQTFPARPWIKRWGSRLIYEPLVRVVLGMHYYDLQCGAKLFRRSVVERVVDALTVTQWAFDIELLYLCRKYGFVVQEAPTVWRDQDGSKLTLGAGFGMLRTIFSIRQRHHSK